MEEVKRMLANFSPEWCSMIICSLYLGGLRLGDTAMLKWDCINMTNKLIKLQTQKTTTLMTIPIVSALEKRLKFLAHSPHEKYVHPNMARRMLNSSNSALNTEFSATVKILGISKTADAVKASESRRMNNKSFHSLRSTAIIMLNLAGVPQAIAMQIAGHSNKSIHEIYVKPSLDQIIQAMQSLAI